MRRILSYIMLAVAIFMPKMATADDARTIQGEYMYIGNGDKSRDECKRLALQGARMNALSQAFGTIVDVTTYSNLSSDHNFFDQRGTTITKGEWISDVEEPKYTISLDEEGNYIVVCKVKGKAREISNESVEFECETLKNASDRKFATTDFIHGDYMCLYFQAPVDGYMVAYLVDQDNNAWKLLPYANTTATTINKKKQYYFYRPENDQNDSNGFSHNLRIETPKAVERNDIYVLFSPNPFNKALDKTVDSLLPPKVEYKDFAEWLGRVRRNDKKMGLKLIPITIMNPNPQQ